MTPTLVLLPGLDGTRFLLQPLLDKLVLDAKVVEYPPTLPSRYEDLLPLVLDALPTDRDFVLLGWSFSGPLALMAAATKPKGLRGVVLVGSFIKKPLAWIPTAARHLARSWLFYPSGLLARAKTSLSGFGTPSLTNLLVRAHATVPAAVMAARVRQVLTVDASAELCACPTPILYLAGNQDWVVPKRNLAMIQRLRPDVRARFIPGPHLAMAVNPAEAAHELQEFVQQLVE